MDLYLLRHGIAISRDDPRCPPDPERSLTARGVIRTRRACRGLRVLGVQVDAIASSPYLRAWQTAEIAADELGFDPARILRDERLEPAQPPAAAFELLREIEGRSVLFVGHAPNLDFIAARAVGCAEPVTELKKAGAALVQFDGSWDQRGVLTFVMEPRALRKLRKLID